MDTTTLVNLAGSTAALIGASVAFYDLLSNRKTRALRQRLELRKLRLEIAALESRCHTFEASENESSDYSEDGSASPQEPKTPIQDTIDDDFNESERPMSRSIVLLRIFLGASSAVIGLGFVLILLAVALDSKANEDVSLFVLLGSIAGGFFAYAAKNYSIFRADYRLKALLKYR